MQDRRKKLPVGVDLFDQLIREDYYYLDKTDFIGQLLQWRGKVNLFTRPRRFGKTLNMSMLKSFFEINSDPSLFRGLAIARETELCKEFQGKFPVVFLSLKSVEGRIFEEALRGLSALIGVECRRLSFLLESKSVKEPDRDIFARLCAQQASEAELKSALTLLMRMLHDHYQRQAILLIDEYDVPLDKANERGYYRQMVDFLRGFFGEAFKTNPDLYFAAVTGCLRISKESIFTGINNLKIDTISHHRYNEFFGFTDSDVRQMLADYGLSGAYAPMKEWYDGYRFGDMDIYCPWDVINHCDRLLEQPSAKPEAYWMNTSANGLVKRFIEKADDSIKADIETLIAGGAVCKRILENLTYDELDTDMEHLWSVLYLTGYLTLDKSQPETEDGRCHLVIPNREVKEIFIEKIRKWFSERIEISDRSELFGALWRRDAKSLQKQIHNVLLDAISYYDYHENYYHALLVGLLYDKELLVRSNREAGEGRSDITIEDARGNRATIIEVKHSQSYGNLEADSERAVLQIEETQYAWPYLQRDYTVIACGIAFAGKDCRVVMKELS